MAIYAVKAIPFGTLTSSVTSFALSGRMRLYGFAVKNTSSSATAEVDFYDGQGSGGILIAGVTLAANESAREWWNRPGVTATNGVAVVWVSGSVSGSIFVLYPYGVDPDELDAG